MYFPEVVIRNNYGEIFEKKKLQAAAKTSTTPEPSASTQSTTPAPFRISRQEFNRILMRNLKGLVRLYNLELDAALKVRLLYDCAISNTNIQIFASIAAIKSESSRIQQTVEAKS